MVSRLGSIPEARAIGRFDERAERLATRFWPGPLTLVVPVNPKGRTCELARAGLDTIALREPSHPVARALLELHDGPLAAPSANPSGKVLTCMPVESAR